MHNLHNNYLSKPLIQTSKKEIQDLVIAWFGVSLAFAIVFMRSGMYPVRAIVLGLIGVGTGFLFHELAHKFVAQKYDCWAEFRADYKMIGVAILLSISGFIFAAPGAVMIRGYHITLEQNGKISLAGPLANFVIAIMFLLFSFMISNPIILYIFKINAWLGLFNLIPFGNFDGAKILRWDKVIYGGVVAMGIVLLIIDLALPYIR